MKQYLNKMFEEQVNLNNKLFPEWRQELTPKDWFAEVMGELIEAMESTNHKWWSKKETDKVNLIVEIVDVWHFFLSSLAYYNQSTRELIFDIIETEFNKKEAINIEDKDLGKMTRRLIVDIFQNSSLSKMIDYKSLVKLTKLVGIGSLLDLYNFYLIKKTLNQFRKDNGYKEGKYIKNWLGEEDNYYIFNWYNINKNNLVYDSDEEYKNIIYNQLKLRYDKVINES